MAERYDHLGNANGNTSGPGGEDCPYAWISEWLCEYVDGTMDPSMQAVFEEYMEANPELAEHVERLCRTRTLLSECECRQQAASGRAKARLHRPTGGAPGEGTPEGAPAGEDADAQAARIEAQIEEALAGGGDDRDEALPLPQSAGAVVIAASAMTLMLGVGLYAGAVLFAEPAGPRAASRPAATEQVAPERPAVPSRGLRRRTAATSGLASAPDWPDWNAPPLPLKKMPTRPADSAGALSSFTLLQSTRLNLTRP